MKPNEAFDRLKEADPCDWLAAPPSLVQYAKQASEILFSLSAESFEKAPLSKLYTDRFDAEQIWQQIDLQSQPILTYLRRKIKTLEKSRDGEFFTGLEVIEEKNIAKEKVKQAEKPAKQPGSDKEDESEEGSEEEEEVENGLDSGEEEDEDNESGDEEGGDKEPAGKNGVEDSFFKISEMEKFLDRTDAEGVFGTGAEEEGDGDEASEDDDDVDDLEADQGGNSEDGSDKELGFGEYEDFFGKGSKKGSKEGRKPKTVLDEEEGSEEDGGEESTPANLESRSSQDGKLSAHERRQEKIEKQIKQLEKASIDPKDWTQQGEVTAKKRPKNSALEVELDFEHNARPPPVITDEVTASLEDIIRARIAEGRFDDVQRQVNETPTAPRERIELDESKSQKGLGEIYEEEYMQKSGLAALPVSTAENLKQQASELFKTLCGRLDALSHYHFAPRPVIEDMGVRADIPALAMEEVAPLAVSEASMLAPEEIFKGKDAMKGEAELSPEERKRRRAQKKRKRKGMKQAEEAQQIPKKLRTIGSAIIEPQATPGLKIGHSSYSKSSKVFARLDSAKDVSKQRKDPPQKDAKQMGQPVNASFLKL